MGSHVKWFMVNVAQKRLIKSLIWTMWHLVIEERKTRKYPKDFTSNSMKNYKILFMKFKIKLSHTIWRKSHGKVFCQLCRSVYGQIALLSTSSRKSRLKIPYLFILQFSFTILMLALNSRKSLCVLLSIMYIEVLERIVKR